MQSQTARCATTTLTLQLGLSLRDEIAALRATEIPIDVLVGQCAIRFLFVRTGGASQWRKNTCRWLASSIQQFCPAAVARYATAGPHSSGRLLQVGARRPFFVAHRRQEPSNPGRNLNVGCRVVSQVIIEVRPSIRNRGLKHAQPADHREMGFRIRQLRGGESPAQIDAHRAISTKLSPE